MSMFSTLLQINARELDFFGLWNGRSRLFEQRDGSIPEMDQ